MRFVRTLLFAVLALSPLPALAQATQIAWGPTVGFYGRDGGNDSAPLFPLVTNSHGTIPIAASSPGVGSFFASFGTVVNTEVNGTDANMVLSFYTPASGQSLIVAGSAMFVVTLVNAYSPQQAVPDGGTPSNYTATCAFAGPAAQDAGYTVGGPSGSGYYTVATATGFTVYNTDAITPLASTLYHFQCNTAPAGAAY